MSDSDQSQPTVAPRLLSPVQEAVIDGSRVTFRWTPARNATGYRLEVACNREFDPALYVQTLGSVTEHTAENAFDTHCDTHFWRVIALFPHGESQGETIESFISTHKDQADLHFSRPTRMERMGPLSELMTGGSEDPFYLKTKNVDPDPVVFESVGHEATEFYEEEDEVGVEHENLEFAQIWRVMLIVMAVVVVITGLLFVWTRVEVDRVRLQRAGEAVYPEIRQLQAQAREELGSYELLDTETGRYRIPIERAMELMLSEAYEQNRPPTTD